MPDDITVRHVSTRLPALSALFVLALSAALALPSVPGHALPMAGDDSGMAFASEIVVKEDETYTVKVTLSESESTPVLSKSLCNKDSVGSTTSGTEDLEVTFKEEGDTRTCTLSGSGSVSDSHGEVSHSGDEFTVKTPDFNDEPSSSTMDMTQSVTFPGKVTEADGGSVDGNKVSFSDGDSHRVKGKDKAAAGTTSGSSQSGAGESSSTATWVWGLGGLLVVAAIGGIIAVIVMNQGKKNQPLFSPYATPAQGYAPNQAFPVQPGQPAQPYQPGYMEPAAQPYQQPYQPGYTEPAPQPYSGQPGQPYQPGYAEPVQPYNGQPYQPGQPAQPYQPGYTEPAAQPYNGQPVQPYQQPYNGQLGQPGQPGQPY